MSDRHDCCVSHAPCSRENGPFDPAACSVCSRWVCFLLHKDITKTWQQWLNIRARWTAVRKLRSKQKKPALWKTPALSSRLKLSVPPVADPELFTDAERGTLFVGFTSPIRHLHPLSVQLAATVPRRISLPWRRCQRPRPQSLPGPHLPCLCRGLQQSLHRRHWQHRQNW